MKRSNHKTINIGAVLAVAALALGWASTAAAGPAEDCEAAKLKASGDKAKCLLKAEADSVKSGTSPNTTQCVDNFNYAFAAAEAKYGNACPTVGDVNDIELLVDACRDEVADALSPSGSPPPTCPQFPATGAGDAGGAPLSYTDNGDGTITDNNTKLMWEKQSDDGTIHDKDNTYTWANASTVHVAGLNTAPCFAGHCDWRLPNVKEQQSIVNYGTRDPAVSLAFNNSCDSGDTVTDGSCTATVFPFDYWSSTTVAGNSTLAWSVNFSNGVVAADGKSDAGRVRAVR